MAPAATTKQGAAFVVHHAGVVLHAEAFSLPAYSTVFLAEMLAIKLAAEWTLQNLNKT